MFTDPLYISELNEGPYCPAVEPATHNPADQVLLCVPTSALLLKTVADDSRRRVVAVQLKGLQSKAKSAVKSVGNNPAQDFANQGKKAVAQAKPAVNKAKVPTVRCITLAHEMVVLCECTAHRTGYSVLTLLCHRPTCQIRHASLR